MKNLMLMKVVKANEEIRNNLTPKFDSSGEIT